MIKKPHIRITKRLHSNYCVNTRLLVTSIYCHYCFFNSLFQQYSSIISSEYCLSLALLREMAA